MNGFRVGGTKEWISLAATTPPPESAPAPSSVAMDYTKLDEHITALREGNTLTENQVKALCEKVRPIRDPETSKNRLRAVGATDDPSDWLPRKKQSFPPVYKTPPSRLFDFMT
jgi:hypothetical protein